jgi:hypothetical protein
LTSVFNACVEALENLRSLHFEYAAAYIFLQAQTDAKNPHAVGTGGTPFMPYLKKHRDETAQNRLEQSGSCRRAVSALAARNRARLFQIRVNEA